MYFILISIYEKKKKKNEIKHNRRVVLFPRKLRVYMNLPA